MPDVDMYWQILMNQGEEWNVVLVWIMSLVILGVRSDSITLPISVMPHGTHTSSQESTGNDTVQTTESTVNTFTVREGNMSFKTLMLNNTLTTTPFITELSLETAKPEVYFGQGVEQFPENLTTMIQGNSSATDLRPIEHVKPLVFTPSGERNLRSNVLLPWLTSLPGDGNSSVLTRAVSGHTWNHLYVWVTLASAAMVLLIAFIVVTVRRLVFSRGIRYTLLKSSSPTDRLQYMYRPSQGGALDEEYEHTFVGVTVPLLHQVSII